MKKIIFLGVAVLATVVGCNKNEFSPAPEKAGVTTLTISVPEVAESKTTIGDLEDGFRKVYWANGDQINVNGVTSQALVDVPDKSTFVTFSFDSELVSPYSYVFPASQYVANAAPAFDMPENVKDGVFTLVGSTDLTGDALVYGCGMLKISIKANAGHTGCALKAIKVTSDNQIAGEFYLTGEGIKPLPAGKSLNSVTLSTNVKLSTESAKDFFIPVAAGTHNLTVKILDEQGHYMEKSTTSAKTIRNGKVLALTEFEFVPTSTQVDVEISSAAEWNAFADTYNADPTNNNVFVKITADLDFTGIDAKCIGSYSGHMYFNGVIDGNNKKISNLNGTHELVGAIDPDGTVKDLTIDESCSFNVDYDADVPKHFGPFTEYVKGKLLNCTNKAAITLNKADKNNNDLYIGGICGRIREGLVENCVNSGAITLAGTYSSADKKFLYVGGICGWLSNADGVIKSCTNSGAIENAAVSSSVFLGGIAGTNAGTIDGCTNSAPQINSTTVRDSGDPCKFIYHGGIVGNANGGTVKNCVNSANLTSSQIVKQGYFGGTAAEVSTVTVFEGNTSSGDIITTAGLRNVFAGGLFGRIRADKQTVSLSGTPFTGKISVSGHESTTAAYIYAGGIAGLFCNEASLIGSSCSLAVDITIPLSIAAAGHVALGGVVGGAGDEGSYKATGKKCTISGISTSGQVKITGSEIKYAYVRTCLGGILGSALSTIDIRNCNSSAAVYFAEANTTSNSNGKTTQLGGIVGYVLPASTDAASVIDNCTASGNVYNYAYNNNVGWPSTAWTGCMIGGIIGSYGYATTNDVPITISNCTSTANRYGFRGSTGCIAGFVQKATIQDCNVPSGNAVRGAPAAGIAANAVNSAIVGCTVKNSISGRKGGSQVAHAGGIVGVAENTSVDGCRVFSTITTDDDTKHVGGIVGNPDASCTIGATTACSYGGSVGGTAIDVGNVATYAIGNAAMTPAAVTYWDGTL